MNYKGLALEDDENNDVNSKNNSLDFKDLAESLRYGSIKISDLNKNLEKKVHRHRLYERDNIYDAIFHQAPIGIAIHFSDVPSNLEDNPYLMVNPMFEKILGRTREDIIKTGWMGITHPDDLEEDMESYRRLQSGEITSYSMDKRFIKPDGSLVWVHMVVAHFHVADQKNYNHICLIQDITREKEISARLEESERSKSLLLSNLQGMAYRSCFDSHWTMEFVSDGCFQLTGYHPKSLINNKDISFNEMILPKYREILRNEWNRVVSDKMDFKYDYEIITASGEIKWVQEIGRVIFGPKGGVEALEGIIIDISELKNLEKTLLYTNDHDIMTGLYNLSYLEAQLKDFHGHGPKGKGALICINLNDIHMLSLKYGLNYSINLIRDIAYILEARCNESCHLYRIYEYQFAFYKRDYGSRDEIISFCNNIKQVLEARLSIDRIRGCIGVVELEYCDSCDVENLLKNLLLTSERNTKASEDEFCVQFFDKDMKDWISREETIVTELAEISRGQGLHRLYLHFQPVLDLENNRISGFEALARLNCDAIGNVPPMEFITLAEKSELIGKLGDQIIIKALSFLSLLKKEGYGDILLSINISVIQLLRKNFVIKLIQDIHQMQVDPRNIVLEITESEFASSNNDINLVINDLREMGIRIAIDDFGTGYSSLSRLRELQVDYLKIDKSFIDKIIELSPEDAITGDIITMSHRLGHCVVAEGVEYHQQLDYLRSRCCDKLQGYLVSKPLDEKAALAFLKKDLPYNWV